jgi:hypothetical protein
MNDQRPSMARRKKRRTEAGVSPPLMVFFFFFAWSGVAVAPPLSACAGRPIVREKGLI